MSYVKVSVPADNYRSFTTAARSLGYGKRGDRWKLLDLLLAYAETHPNLFHKR